jgi:hypothetical protein
MGALLVSDLRRRRGGGGGSGGWLLVVIVDGRRPWPQHRLGHGVEDAGGEGLRDGGDDEDHVPLLDRLVRHQVVDAEGDVPGKWKFYYLINKIIYFMVCFYSKKLLVFMDFIAK